MRVQAGLFLGWVIRLKGIEAVSFPSSVGKTRRFACAEGGGDAFPAMVRPSRDFCAHGGWNCSNQDEARAALSLGCESWFEDGIRG
jgi:hypothetical protein